MPFRSRDISTLASSRVSISTYPRAADFPLNMQTSYHTKYTLDAVNVTKDVLSRMTNMDVAMSHPTYGLIDITYSFDVESYNANEGYMTEIIVRHAITCENFLLIYSGYMREIEIKCSPDTFTIIGRPFIVRVMDPLTRVHIMNKLSLSCLERHNTNVLTYNNYNDDCGSRSWITQEINDPKNLYSRRLYECGVPEWMGGMGISPMIDIYEDILGDIPAASKAIRHIAFVGCEDCTKTKMCDDCQDHNDFGWGFAEIVH